MKARASRPEPKGLWEVAWLFLKLGCVGFGGPAAHIALMRREVVLERKWTTDQEFLDLVGATNLIPGPNSTELAIHLGFLRAGWLGLLVAGVSFISPAMVIVMAFAWAYVEYGSVPQAGWVLYGVKPVILAILVHALWGLAKTAVKGPLLAVTVAAVVGLYLIGTNEILLLLLAGAAVVLTEKVSHFSKGDPQAHFLLPLLALSAPIGGIAATPFNLTQLFLVFLKIGAVLYGSGYVLLAYLRADFVEGWGWLTDAQLMDAVAVGQFTPGPVLTTATFIGYVLGGWSAALLATIAIFLPSFVFVALLGPALGLVRRWPWTRSFLDGVNAASLGLLAGVTWQLGRSAVVDSFAILLALGSTFAVFRLRMNTVWIVVGGGLLGLGYRFFVS